MKSLATQQTEASPKKRIVINKTKVKEKLLKILISTLQTLVPISYLKHLRTRRF